ncbi:hypothetical protein PPYR_03900 [Photinus pyralis]|uniref:RNA-directed DNA polymerase n=1 Tax=Photinus pyralis TaxID=7054 RepID=A0A5N4AWK5_PHOPY|nr:hypothetical protein PPYR_03900 [Photinus pyralis]
MINYLLRFIPNLSELTAPLRELLKDDVEFLWCPQHTEAFKIIKDKIVGASVLANYDDNKEITIQADASKSGLGCCLMQLGKPVYYASRALSDAEMNYAMIEKELLAIVFATNKFHNFIYGREVNVITDHKPLLGIMKKKIADIVSPRLQRMKLKLLKYSLKMTYLPGKYMYVADLLSLSYLNDKPEEPNWIKDIVHSVSASINISDSKKLEFIKETKNDPVLSEIIKYHKDGWPNKKTCFKSLAYNYYKFQNEIVVENDLIFLNNRIIVPTTLRNYILSLLHESHFGIEKTKARARQLVYWPGLSRDIENMINRCVICERYRVANVKEPMLMHDIPELPFNKLAVDILECRRKNYLVVQDYLSKWLEMIPIKFKTSVEIINKLNILFSTHGVPKTIIADNNPFNSYECKDFARKWNFEFVTSSPRYPRGNGQAERAVQTAKNILKKCYDDNKDITLALLEYRNSPLSGLHLSPSQILMSRRTNSKIPIHSSLLKPKVQDNVTKLIQNRQQIHKSYYDRNTKTRKSFSNGENIVMFRDKKWEPARIIQKHDSPRSYVIKDVNGHVMRRNSQHLRKSFNEFKPISSTCDDLPAQNLNANFTNANISASDSTIESPNLNPVNVENNISSPAPQITRPMRVVHKPLKFKDYVL